MMKSETLFSKILGTRVGISTPRNKKSFVSIAVLLMAMVTATVSAGTVTKTIKETGTPGEDCDYTSIQATFNGLPASLVDDGNSYILEIIDNSQYDSGNTIPLQGKTTDADNYVTLKAGSGYTPSIHSWSDYGSLSVGCDYTVVEGITFTGAANRAHLGLWDAPDHCTIRNCTFSGPDAEGISITGVAGGGPIKYNKIYKNTFNSNIGVFVISGQYDEIYNNVFNCGTYGVYLRKQASTGTSDESIINNTFYCSPKGLYVFHDGSNVANTVFKNNIVYATGSGNYAIYINGALASTFTISDYNDLYATDGAKVGYINGTDYATLSE